MRELLRYLLEYDSNEEVWIETSDGLSEHVKCCVRRDKDNNIIGVIIQGE